MGHQQQFVAEAMNVDRENGWIELDVKNRFTQNDNLLLLTPQGNYHFSAQHIINKHGQSVEVAPGSGHVVSLKLPFEVNATDAMLVRIYGGE